MQVPVINAGIQKQPLTGPVNMVVQKSGYLYVYVSNESNMNVYFYDVVVNHKSGPVLEVTNFRAFGTEIATWGERAYGKLQNKYLYNGKELQSKEFSDGSGIDEYDYGMRHYDPLLGRWMVVDALSEVSRRWSVYNYCYDNPLRFMDPDGMYVSPFQRSESNSYGNEIAEKREEAKQIQAAFQMISDGWNVKHSGKNADKNSSKKKMVIHKMGNLFLF